MKTIKEIYAQHAEFPYIAPQYKADLQRKPIPKRNMVRTAEGLLPGHVILLWRIQFGTYTTKSALHKYFYTTYGIDAQKELVWLISEDYIKIDSAFSSLKHISALQLKAFLKDKQVSGLSKMKRSDLEAAVQKYFSEEELSKYFDLRGYSLLPKGKEILAQHTEIVDRHPKKTF